MSRRLLWSIAGLLALLALGSLWWSTHVERVPVSRREAPGPEARRNPYLALQMFLAQMGRPLSVLSEAGQLDALGPGGVLILDQGRGRHMTNARVDQLLAWVEAGGYLIVSPEAAGDPDPLLERLGVRWFEPGKDTPEARPAPPARQAWQQVELPGGGQFRLAPWFGPGLLSAAPPLWRGGQQAEGDGVVHLGRAAGNVTVIINGAGLWHNDSLGQADHAEFLWALLERYQPGGPLRLGARLYVPNLFVWLGEHAPYALLSLALLIVLGLWRAVPRFGVIAAEAGPDRRALGEHLSAVGRYLWRNGGLPHWLKLSREHFHGRLALAQPALAALPLGLRVAALARASRLPAAAIGQALGGPADTPLGYTQAVRTLCQLEHRLFEETPP